MYRGLFECRVSQKKKIMRLKSFCVAHASLCRREYICSLYIYIVLFSSPRGGQADPPSLLAAQARKSVFLFAQLRERADIYILSLGRDDESNAYLVEPGDTRAHPRLYLLRGEQICILKILFLLLTDEQIDPLSLGD